MEFTFETQYNTKTMAVMAKALRKTVRKKHSRRSHIFGWIITILSALLLFKTGVSLTPRTVVTLFMIFALLTALLFEDRLNGYIAKKRLLPGTNSAVSVFSGDGFTTTTEIGSSLWRYDTITAIAETQDFFVFIFSPNHAQLYDKRTLKGGSPDQFRHFMEEVTSKAVVPVR